VTLPEQWKRGRAEAVDLNEVGERRRLYRRVRPAFPAYDVARKTTYFRRITALPVLLVDGI